MSTDRVGIRCVVPAEACKKFGKRKTWLWEQVRDNPAFPKPFRLTESSKTTVFLERELDDYIARRIAASRGESVS